MRNYNYKMGIMVGNTEIPDPSEWTYQVGDLDTSGKRDAKGLLHRAYVATKINYEFKWSAIEWEMLQTILDAVNKEKFKLTAPDPRTFKTTYKGNYYVGDRTGGAKYFYSSGDMNGNQYIPDTEHNDMAQFDLKLKFIEY